MLWILNENFYKEEGYLTLVKTLDRLGLSKQIVKTVPMTDRIICADYDSSKAREDVSNIPEPEIDNTKPIIIMGSYTLAKIASKRGWAPGAFIKNLDYVSMRQGFGAENLLNEDMAIVKIRDLVLTKNCFIRPVEDSKQFAGKIYSPAEFNGWRDTLLEIGPSDIMDTDTLVVTSSPKDIYSETRCFCVGNKVISSSIYKTGGRVFYDPNVSPRVIEFATEMIAKWTPDKAFVIDISDGPMGLKIIEMNCLNAAGFYAADVQKIVIALEENFEGFTGEADCL